MSYNKYWDMDGGFATHGQFGESGTDSLSAKGILLELQQLQGDCRQSLTRRSIHQHILTHTHTHTRLCKYHISMLFDIIKYILLNLRGILLLQTIVFSLFKPGLLLNVPCRYSFLCIIIFVFCFCFLLI